MIRRPPRSTPFPYPPLFRSGRLRALAVHEHGPRRCELNAGEQGCETADKHQTKSRFTIGTFHTCRCPQRSEEHTSELQSRPHLVCRLLLEKKKQVSTTYNSE